MRASRTRVHRRVAILAAALLSALAGPPAAEAAAAYVRLYLSESKIIRVDGLKRVSVTNSDVAEPVIISPNEIMVNGKQVGRTSLYVWDQAGRTEIQLVVRPFTEELEKAIIDEINNPSVGVQLINEGRGERLFLRGRLPTEGAKREVMEIAAAYVGRDSIVDLLTVEGVSEAPQDALRRLIDNPEVRVQVIQLPGAGGGSSRMQVLLEGYVDDQRDYDRIQAVASAFVGGNATQLTNLIEVVNPLQVMVEAHLVELTRTQNDQNGVSWGTVGASVGGGNVTLTDFQEGTATAVEEFAHPSLFGPLAGIFGPVAHSVRDLKRTRPLFATLRWQLQSGKARIIENPKVVTRSGQLARLEVGGEVGSIVSAGFGAQSAAFRPFGLELAVTPTLDHKGNIETHVRVVLSNPDASLGATLTGSTVPGFRRRATENRVSVKDGEHIIISGLIDRQEQELLSKVPILHKIPVLGKLFQSKRFQNSETELVIIVTPHLLASQALRERFEAEERGPAAPAGNVTLGAVPSRSPMELAGADGDTGRGNEGLVREMFAGFKPEGATSSDDPRLVAQGGDPAPELVISRSGTQGAVVPEIGTMVERLAQTQNPMTGEPMSLAQVTRPSVGDPSERVRQILESRRDNGRGHDTRRELALRTQGALSLPEAKPAERASAASPPVPPAASGSELDPALAPPVLEELVPTQGSLSSRIHGILDGMEAGSGAEAPAPKVESVRAPGAGSSGIDQRVDDLFQQIRSKLEGAGL